MSHLKPAKQVEGEGGREGGRGGRDVNTCSVEKKNTLTSSNKDRKRIGSKHQQQ